jgi:DNA-binding transcriptional MerR regulator
MFRIGEFSKLAQVSVRMLRYYDEMGLLKPNMINELTGYRMYSASQLPTLNKIIYLRDSGFNVSEIAIAINNTEKDFVIQQLEKKYSEIEEIIKSEKQKLMKINIAKYELLKGKAEMHYHVYIKAIPSYHVLSLRKVIPNYYTEGELWKELVNYAERQKIQFSGNTFSIYHDKEYKETEVDVELCVSVKQVKLKETTSLFTIYETESVPIMACTMVYGDFSNIAGVYLALAEWFQNHPQYQMNGSTRQIVHRGPWNEENKNNYLTEIQIPLENV